MIGRSIVASLALTLAVPVAAAPAGDISPMHLPNGGGYLQPGNPNRGISAVSADSPLARQVKKRCKAASDKACARLADAPRDDARRAPKRYRPEGLTHISASPMKSFVNIPASS